MTDGYFDAWRELSLLRSTVPELAIPVRAINPLA
jgi:hypothetical protein